MTYSIFNLIKKNKFIFLLLFSIATLFSANACEKDLQDIERKLEDVNKKIEENVGEIDSLINKKIEKADSLIKDKIDSILIK